MADLFTAQNLVAFLTLLALEIVLGVDNVIFIAILSAKLPVEQQARARTTGIALAVIMRLVLLFFISFIMGLTVPLFTIWGHGFSGRDLILLFGGLFLIGKSVHELHDKLEAAEHGPNAKVAATFSGVILQIVLMDIIFSLDSVITAVGISGNMPIMVTAVVVAAAVMLFFAGAIAAFVEKHPTFKVLALSFLIMIGAVLVLEGWSSELAHTLHVKNYVYFAMFFAVVIELINMRIRPAAAKPVELHNTPKASAVLPDTHAEMASDIY